jgi:hypothetical protein
VLLKYQYVYEKGKIRHSLYYCSPINEQDNASETRENDTLR